MTEQKPIMNNGESRYAAIPLLGRAKKLLFPMVSHRDSEAPRSLTHMDVLFRSLTSSVMSYKKRMLEGDVMELLLLAGRYDVAEAQQVLFDNINMQLHEIGGAHKNNDLDLMRCFGKYSQEESLERFADVKLIVNNLRYTGIPEVFPLLNEEKVRDARLVISGMKDGRNYNYESIEILRLDPYRQGLVKEVLIQAVLLGDESQAGYLTEDIPRSMMLVVERNIEDPNSLLETVDLFVSQGALSLAEGAL